MNVILFHLRGSRARDGFAQPRSNCVKPLLIDSLSEAALYAARAPAFVLGML
jgi:hypothetical protein